ncbi:MAG: glycosyltransferase family 4 protein [Thermoleophilaceae bacterium]
MRILYLHQFFMTREGTGGTRSYELARRLVDAGHEVTMVTAGSGRERVVDGIRVVEARGGYGDYVAATGVGYARRLAAFLLFAASATVAAVRGPRPDVVFATSPPLTMALPGILAARRWRVPLVFEVRDLWPEAPIQMGALRSPLARRLARALERATYRAATEVVALSPGMRDGVVAAGVAPERVALIPNASDLDLFSPQLDPGDVRERLGLGDDFVCSYFGTMGEANDLTQVVEAAEVLRTRGERGVRFVLQGDGKRRADLERAVRERRLDAVVLAPAGDKLSAARLAAASDACMTLFKDVPILATNSPNKLFDTFAAGRPAIVNTGGWQRELVEDNDAGLFVRPGDPASLADAVVRLRDDRGLARRQGENARRLAEREFDRELLAERLREVLERAAGSGG